MSPLLANSIFSPNKACCGVLRFYKCANELQLVQFTLLYHYYAYYIRFYAIEHTWCDVDPLGRSSFRWAAGTTAGPMSCRCLRGIHRQPEHRIQRRRSRWEAHIKQGYGPLSCHPMDSEYKSIEIEDLIGLRPVVKLLWYCPVRLCLLHCEWR